MPQAGNPRPRLFRLAEDRAIINRMGFNNDGCDAVLARLSARRGGGIVGVNIGANRDSADRIGDYVTGLAAFAPVASYVTVNVSSPNTPGLRDLQARSELENLVARLGETRPSLQDPSRSSSRSPPISTGTHWRQSSTYVWPAVSTGSSSPTRRCRVRRFDLRHAGEAGGLSGRPLFDLSTRTLAATYRLVGGRIPLIGVGGIDSADAAWAKITAGASLVQLYTALAFEGPELVTAIRRGLSRRLDEHKMTSIAEAVGTNAEDW
jgi:dihydroorotate dehydrogenase